MRATAFLSAALAFVIGGLTAPAQAAPDQPNILFIMADDLGKEWISAYGAEDVETPHIDRLAETGMKFTNAYCMPQCTPTRVTLLTGQYPFHHGWTNHFDVPRWGSGAHFDAERNASFARLLREAGYATAIAGKWQIDDFRVEPRALYAAGFDAWAMWTGGEGGNRSSNKRYWDPYIHMGDAMETESRTHHGKYGPDIYTDFLIDFMEKHKNEPLLLFYPMCLVHAPRPATPDHPDLEGDKKVRHTAMVRYMDKLVGRLVKALETNGIRDDTIVIFTTDNGTAGIQTTANGHQFNGSKGNRIEPGVSMPFIVSCPGIVPEGVETDALTDFTDILPTFAELAGTQPNDRWQVDGHSIAPVMLGKAEQSPREWIYAQGGGVGSFENQRVVPQKQYDERVIRGKRWKLWVDDSRRAVALYDLQNDPWEKNNMIDSDDPQVQAARQQLMSVIKQMPKVDAAPRYDPNPAMPWDRYDSYKGMLEAPSRRVRD